MGEIKRFFNKKAVYIIMISLILCVLCYVLTSIGTSGISEFLSDNNIYNTAINNISKNDIQDVDKYIEDLNENENKNISKDLIDYINYINGYSEFIENTLLNAKKAQEFSIFSKDNDYVMRNINKIYNDYDNLTEVNLQIINEKAFVNYEKYISVISIFVIFIILYILFNIQKEYDNGEILFSYSAKNGRFVLALKRNILITIIAIAFNLLFNSILYIISNILYGYVDYTAPIQSISSYSKCSINMSIGIEWIVNVLETGMGIALIAMIAHFLFNFIHNKYISICLFGSLFLAEWKLSLIVQNNSINRILANINLFRIIDYSTYFKNYQNINIFNYPISSHLLIFIITLVLFIVFFLLSAIIYAKRYPYKNIFLGKLKNVFEVMFGKFSCKFGFVYFELYKMLIRGKKLLIVIAFILIEIVLIYGTKVDFPARQRQMDNVYEEYGGNDWDSFNKYIQDYENEINESETKIEIMKNTSVDDENAHNILMEAERLNSDINEKKKILNEYKSVAERKVKIEEDKGIVIYAMSDRGYNEIYGSNSYIRESGIIIMLIVITVLISAGYYMEEQQSGVCKLMKCSQYGINKIYKLKLAILCTVILLITMLFVFTDIFLLGKIYEFKYINAPLITLTFMESKVAALFANIKIWQYIMLDIITKLSLVLLSLFVTLELSFKTRSLFYVSAVILLMSIVGVFSIYANVYVKLFIILLSVIIMARYIFVHRNW